MVLLGCFNSGKLQLPSRGERTIDFASTQFCPLHHLGTATPAASSVFLVSSVAQAQLTCPIAGWSRAAGVHGAGGTSLALRAHSRGLISMAVGSTFTSFLLSFFFSIHFISTTPLILIFPFVGSCPVLFFLFYLSLPFPLQSTLWPGDSGILQASHFRRRWQEATSICASSFSSSSSSSSLAWPPPARVFQPTQEPGLWKSLQHDSAQLRQVSGMA